MHYMRALRHHDVIIIIARSSAHIRTYLANLWQRLTKYFLAVDIVCLSSGIVVLMYAAMVDTY